MPVFPNEFLEQVQSSNPIETVMESYVHLIRRGRLYVCNCPFHSEKTPSCTIFPDTQSFYCFGCGVGGNVITFTQQIENLNFVDAVKLLAKRSGLTIPENEENKQSSQLRIRILEINRETANFYYRNLLGENKSGLQYFKNRGLSPAIIKKYGLGFAPGEWDKLTSYLLKKGFTEEELIAADVSRRSKNGTMYDNFRNRVIYPIIDVRGNVIGFGGRVLDDSVPKYLNTSKTLVFDKGKNLFSLNFAKNTNTSTMILAEGYMDVIAIHQAGFENAIATLGTAITADQARRISQYVKEVIIAYDSDNAGQQATQKAINHFNDVGLTTKILHMEGAKDPDEYIKKFGADRFRLLLENAGDAINFRLDRCEQGLNLQTESDRVKFLEKVVNVLADIDNPLTREVYISRTAQKWSISDEVLHTQIEYRRDNRKSLQKQKEWTGIVRKTVAPESQNNSKNSENCSAREKKAQESILGYLLRYPEEIQNFTTIITPEKFPTPFYKKIYTVLYERTKQNLDTSIATLGTDFSAEEMGKISGIYAKKNDFPPTKKVAEDCAAILNEHTLDDVLTDEDLLRLVQDAKKHKKRI